MPRPVYLTAYDYLCAQGSSCDAESALACSSRPFRTPAVRTAQTLGQSQPIPYFNAFAEPLLDKHTLYTQLTDALQRTVSAAGWPQNALQNVPLLFGSTAYVMADREYHHYHKPHAASDYYTINEIATHLSRRFRNPNVFSFATSCTSAAQALAHAAALISSGRIEQALVIGFESFNRFTFEHFNTMHLLSHESDNGIFNGSRGMILGEALACLALSAQAPDAPLCAEIKGIVSQTDSENLTASSAAPLRRLLQSSLKAAGIQADALRGVKLHGSGAVSDTVEQDVLSELMPHTSAILFKPYIGHTLGASGALETALLAECLQRGSLRALPAATPGLTLPVAHGGTLPPGAYLNYYLGFGGSHCAWIIDWKPT